MRRLQALEECTDLELGFQLALRDMEIRGAGNLLGAEQSGFIADMGFELYQKILDEAVQELRQQEFADVFDSSEKREYANEDIAIDVGADALLPSSTLHPTPSALISTKNSSMCAPKRKQWLSVSELRDRYGAPPVQAEALVAGVRLRVAALPLGFTRISVKHGVMLIDLPPESDAYFYANHFHAIAAHTSAIPAAKFTSNKKTTVIEIPVQDVRHALDVVREYRRAVNIQYANRALHCPNVLRILLTFHCRFPHCRRRHFYV